MFSVSKKLGLAAIVSLGLIVSGCGEMKENTKPTSSEKDHTPSWLFVVQAERGTIEKAADSSAGQTEKKYTLTLTRTDKDHVIKFTDRPDRIVMYESAKKIRG
jgi:hypothetical protein